MSVPSGMACGLYTGWVSHQRLRPLRHRLRYRTYALLLDLDTLADTLRPLRWLSLNRFNLLSFHEADHGDGRPGGLAAWVRQRLCEAGLPADGPVRLMAMPRVLGHGFNPLSVFFCHDGQGRLCAVLYEVHNTFGERHGYLVEVPASDADAGRSRPLQHRVAKDFHVSPFMDMAMTYRFRLQPPGMAGAPDAGEAGGEDDAYRLTIAVHDDQGPVLVAHQQARPRPLSDGSLLRAFFGHPLLTLKVVAGIHWEALKLWRRGIAVRRKPDSPPPSITFLRHQETAP